MLAQASLSTGAGGTALITFPDGHSIQFAADSKIILDPNYTFVRRGFVKFTSRCFRALSDRQTWKCKYRTNSTAVIVVGGTQRDDVLDAVFTIDSSGSSAKIAVEQGTVDVTSPTGEVTRLGAGQNRTVAATNNIDLLRYNTGSGKWAQESYVPGDFSTVLGSWSPAWTVRAAEFNGDGLTDYFLYNALTGTWFKAINDGAADFTYYSSRWAGGQRFYIVDLNGDGKSDVFVYDPSNGNWARGTSLGDGAGDFSYVGGSWATGYQIFPLDLDGNGRTDLFLYNPSSGVWFRAINDGGNGFVYRMGSWSSGWQVNVGDFNGDRAADLFIYSVTVGSWYICLNNGTEFDYYPGAWSPDWTVRTLDLNADGRTDVFVYNAATGRWWEAVSHGVAFSYFDGYWSGGWQVHVADFNRDSRGDLLLYNPVSGVWFQALTAGLGAFTYSNGTWDLNLTVVTNPQFVQTDLYP